MFGSSLSDAMNAPDPTPKRPKRPPSALEQAGFFTQLYDPDSSDRGNEVLTELLSVGYFPAHTRSVNFVSGIVSNRIWAGHKLLTRSQGVTNGAPVGVYFVRNMESSRVEGCFSIVLDNQGVERSGVLAYLDNIVVEPGGGDIVVPLIYGEVARLGNAFAQEYRQAWKLGFWATKKLDEAIGKFGFLPDGDQKKTRCYGLAQRFVATFGSGPR